MKIEFIFNFFRDEKIKELFKNIMLKSKIFLRKESNFKKRRRTQLFY